MVPRENSSVTSQLIERTPPPGGSKPDYIPISKACDEKHQPSGQRSERAHLFDRGPDGVPMAEILSFFKPVTEGALVQSDPLTFVTAKMKLAAGTSDCSAAPGRGGRSREKRPETIRQ